MKIKKKKLLKLDFFASIPDSKQKLLQCPAFTPISLQIFFLGIKSSSNKIRPIHSASRSCLDIDGAGSNETRQGCRLEKYHVMSGATGILMSRRGFI